MAKKATKKIPISLSKQRLNRLYESLCLVKDGAGWYQREKLPELKKKYPWFPDQKRFRAALSDIKELQKFMAQYNDALKSKVEADDDDW